MALILGACSAKSDEKSAAQAPAEQLIVWADADPDGGEAPLTVELSCDPLEEIDGAEYVWDPGDGSGEVEGQKVTHTYQRPGVYKARVTVTDARENRGEDDVRIDVELKQD